MQISWAQGWRQGGNCPHGLPKNHTVYNININILYYKDFLPHSCNKSTLFYFIIILACLMCSISIPKTTFSYNGSYIIKITSIEYYLKMLIYALIAIINNLFKNNNL